MQGRRRLTSLHKATHPFKKLLRTTIKLNDSFLQILLPGISKVRDPNEPQSRHHIRPSTLTFNERFQRFLKIYEDLSFE